MVYRRIPEKQVELLRELYAATLHEDIPLSPDEFVYYISERVHVEYMRQVLFWDISGNHNLRQFIRREVYFEGIRLEQNGGNTPDLWQVSGEERRLRITLQRLVNRAIVLYRQTDGDVNRYGENGELDIRCNLSLFDRIE